MACARTPRQVFREACLIARDHGMFVVENPGRFLLFREAKPKNVFVGARSDVAAFRRFVEKASTTTPPATGRRPTANA